MDIPGGELVPLCAFKNDVTPFAENVMNTLLSLQDFVLIYDGTQVDAKAGAGVTENSLAEYTFVARFTATGVTEVSRLEFRIDCDGEGQDLTVQIRGSDFNPDGSNDGTVLKQVVVPKEFLPDPVGRWSVPIDLSGLTGGNYYWIVVLKAGDATNKVDWIGEASQDGSYPVYRRAGDSGAWAASNALHFRVFSGESGELKHGIYGENGYTTVEYDGDLVSKVYRYLPPSDGPAGGVRDIQEYIWSGEYLKSGAVT